MSFESASASSARTRSAGASPRNSFVSPPIGKSGWVHVFDCLPRMYKPDALGATSAVIRSSVAVRPGRADSGQSTLSEASAGVAVIGAGEAIAAGQVGGQGDEGAGHSSGLRGEVGKVRPDFPKVIGPKHLPGYGVPSRPLDVHTLRDRHGALAIGPLPDLGDLDVDGFSKLALPAKMVDCFLNCCHTQTLPSINSKCQQLSSIVASVASKTDFSDIRHQKLKELLATRFGGIQSELAKAIGKNPTQVNHWFSRHRNPNGDTCREIEASLKLPGGWLDDQPVKAPDAGLKELSDMLASIDPAARVGMLTHFRWYIEKFGQSTAPPDESPPVETIEAYAERRRNPAPSRLNKINPIKKRNE